MTKSATINAWIRRVAIIPMLGANVLLSTAPALAQSNLRTGEPQNDYGEEAVSTYMNSCKAAASRQSPPPNMTQEDFQKLLSELCGCTIWELQNRYTLDEFVELSRGLQRNEEWSGKVMQEVVSVCIKDSQAQ